MIHDKATHAIIKWHDPAIADIIINDDLIINVKIDNGELMFNSSNGDIISIIKSRNTINTLPLDSFFPFKGPRHPFSKNQGKDIDNKIKIDDLNLPTRVRNQIYFEGYYYVSDLDKLNKEKLFNIRLFGKASYRALIKGMQDKGCKVDHLL